ncbi:BnaCnng44500D [Brassica napus]|uniref:BnaC09g52870D protein n=1 Tax=Brassica napus TaxID=3708 RepID=A0A078IM30_BRANA|nr:BnaC09g52870D [Brassica napus]CDY64653.1 BnaCnng44500D [Brassica napus]
MMASDPKLKAEMDLQEKLLLLPTQRSVHIANLRSLSLYQCSILLTVSFLALEHLRKKIELSTEWIHAAKLREDEARKAFEAASKSLCEDLNRLVQESSNTQYARLEELKRRLEVLNPNLLLFSKSMNRRLNLY